ncbi:hypothetical protein [Streptomyces capillispiralis]|uniref:Uncharacterized protein n=1 Tax=Streptomyces capillispiralis TaxID=68182 RepID=A0A561TKL3_9ACTN|nr:hypothetical protein [Streptomyces capillispiralis]TWF87590.1 hypothetical protein FHX78_114603 [Streptomyces capillispiralis]GHH93725.1 hypothetical protein GCM10017779_41820 [Streptomyces capillispiralis]
MTATAFVDPYAVEDGTDSVRWPPAEGRREDDYLLAPPHPADRLDSAIDPRDRRRLELHAALTAAGIPPRPEDREAIDSLSALSGSINTTIQRWLHHTL